MGGINVGRWLAGGAVAALVMWVIEGASAMLYMSDMEAALEAHNLAMELTAGTWVMTIVVSLIAGLTLIFFYAAARPRFGPGPKTAVIVAVALWFGAYLLSLLGYQMIGLYPTGMIVMWAGIGLVEMVLAGLAGAWVYREGAAAAAPSSMGAGTEPGPGLS